MKNINILGLFRFSLLAIGLYLTGLAILLSLGFWQLNRAEEKRIFLRQEQVVDPAVITLHEVNEIDAESLRYRQVSISGHYDSEHQFLLDNQILDSQVGYFVMTPFIFDDYPQGKYQAVLVNRGWLPLNKDRRILPDLMVEQTHINLLGRINHFPSVGIHLKGAEIPTEGWPSVVQLVDINILSDKVSYRLLPFQVELDSQATNGYQRKWKRQKIMPPEKHIAYAVQWFGLAITLTILFFWINRRT